MDEHDGFVVIGEGGATGFANLHEAEASDEDNLVQVLQDDLRQEEFMVFLDRMEYEDDARKGFESGRQGVWKQFFLDLPRQRLSVDGDYSDVTDKRGTVLTMEALVRRVLRARAAKKKLLRSTVETKSDPKRGLYSTLAASSPPALLAWIAYVTAAPLALFPTRLALQNKDCEDQEPCPEPAQKCTFALLPHEDLHTARASAALLNSASLIASRVVLDSPNNHSSRRRCTANARHGGPDACQEDCCYLPRPSASNFDVIDKVDAIALFCQQSAVALAFEIVNKQYTHTEFGVHAGDSRASGPVRTEVHEATNDYNHPDIAIKISKSFWLFRIDPECMEPQDIGFVSVSLTFMLFSDEKVSLVLKGLASPQE